MENKECKMTVLKNVRVSFVNVEEPVENLSGKMNYSVQILIDKSETETVETIQKAINKAIKKGKETKWGGKVPKFTYEPLRDGDIELEEGNVSDPSYAGCYFKNASRSEKQGKPGIIYGDKIYSGCYCHVDVSIYPFKAGGNAGIGWGLNNIMFSMDGDRLDGRVSAEKAFEKFIKTPEEQFKDLAESSDTSF